ncbi:hypothetical protein ACJIZ3_007321 [Penstemon smallii]|uniref:UDP-N-acetylglucosamine 1-carboxyvinyltransferase n=1 Tax=Penstemon smallii TaxID=265156 RepID=A0ABD3SAF2_9LAMI
MHIVYGLWSRNGKVYAECGRGRRLKGGSFHLDYPSVGATNTLLMASTLAQGVTALSNVAQEPEVNDLSKFLIKCGAEIEGAGTSNLLIRGKDRLYGCDEPVIIIPDRIEAGTFAIAAAISRSCFSISPVIPAHLTSLLQKLEAAGCKITQTSHDAIQLSGICEENGIDRFKGTGIHIQTGPYPEFPTDLQPQMLAFLTTCKGQSVVQETVFEDRMRHVRELQKMGARVQVSGNTALILGGSNLCGSSVVARDLRGGASLVLAGLAASGTTEIDGVFHIDRGYEDLKGKLQSLGANVKRSSFS